MDKTEFPIVRDRLDAVWIILNGISHLNETNVKKKKEPIVSESLMIAAREQLKKVEGYLEAISDMSFFKSH